MRQQEAQPRSTWGTDNVATRGRAASALLHHHAQSCPTALQGPCLHPTSTTETKGAVRWHASGEGERVIAPEPWEGTLASRRVEEGLSRSFPG